MSCLSAILAPGDIVVDVDAVGMEAVFGAAARLVEQRHGIPASTVVENLRERECLSSTGLGRGVAIPHGRIKGFQKAAAAVLRLRSATAFDAPDGQPVALFVFLLVPKAATPAHLGILAEIAEMLSDRALRATLMACPDPHDLHRAIAGWSTLAEEPAPR
jgi:PTS system nitrogen regulatory IIA component